MLASLISLCLSTVRSVAVRTGILTFHLVCSARPSKAAGGPLGSGFVDRGVLFSSQYAHFEYKPGVHLPSSPLFLSPLPCYASMHISALTQGSTMALGKDLKIQASTKYYVRAHTHTHLWYHSENPRAAVYHCTEPCKIFTFTWTFSPLNKSLFALSLQFLIWTEHCCVIHGTTNKTLRCFRC